MAKGKKYSKKNKVQRFSHVSRESKQRENKEINHKEPFVLKFQNLEQVDPKPCEMAQELIRNEPIDDPEAIIRPHENANR